MADHARLSPSAAGRWVPCPGFVTLAESGEISSCESDNEAAEIGTAAHWYGEQRIAASCRLLDGPKVGDVAPNGVVVDEEMVEATEEYVHDTTSRLRREGVSAGPCLGIEERVFCASIHFECWGTPDLWLWLPDQNRIVIWDYKHGHKTMEVFENWQLIIYACGLWQMLKHGDPHGAPGWVERGDSDLTFELRIVQPRAYHPEGTVRSWVATVEDLRPKWDQARHSARLALEGSAWSCVAGDHCWKCPNRLGCRALRKATAAALNLSESPLPDCPGIESLEIEWLFIDCALSALKNRKDAIENHLIERTKTGARCEFLKVAPGKGKRAWSIPNEQVYAMGEAYGKDLCKRSPITPRQAEIAGVPPDMIKSFTITPATGVKVSRATDVNARRIFRRKE